jgi:hypothetical protein
VIIASRSLELPFQSALKMAAKKTIATRTASADIQISVVFLLRSWPFFVRNWLLDLRNTKKLLAWTAVRDAYEWVIRTAEHSGVGLTGIEET